ncbi:MAG: YraN family protein [Desulfonatronovibrio sp. MSAO_Bac4]|nr:MAG: YraN family protein [Desulfonatronovibrio sp. MSAO_Bac4]
MADSWQDIGKFGEQVAGSYLSEKGYKILERNWRYRRGELDLVCRQGKVIVFVEVKTRSAQGPARAVESLGYQQKQNLLRTANHYLCMESLWENECRFDFISVTIGNQVKVEHVQNAIEFSPVGGSNSPWQPW